MATLLQKECDWQQVSLYLKSDNCPQMSGFFLPVPFTTPSLLILSGQNFKGQGHYGKVKGQIKVTP